MMWVVLLWACAEAPEVEPLAPDLSSRVSFVAVTHPDALPVAVLPAEVVPAPDGLHDVGPGVSGRLERWLVAPGDRVEPGQPLAELQSPELSELEAQAAALASEVRQQQELVTLAVASAQRGVGSSVDQKTAEAQLAATRGAFRSVERRLAAHRDTTTRDGEAWTWRAPTGGVVGELRCALGGIEATDVCVSLVNELAAVLEVRVPERHLAVLSGPATAEFVSADGRSWAFTELSRAPSVDRASRSRLFRFAGEGTEDLLQGTSGHARLSVAAPSDAHGVPVAALTRIEGGSVVFRRAEVGGAPVSVEVLGQDAGMAVVRGLSDGDEVAAKGVFLLKSLALLEAE